MTLLLDTHFRIWRLIPIPFSDWLTGATESRVLAVLPLDRNVVIEVFGVPEQPSRGRIETLAPLMRAYRDRFIPSSPRGERLHRRVRHSPARSTGHRVPHAVLRFARS